MAGKVDLSPILTCLVSGAVGIISGITGLKIAQRNAHATERGQDKVSETTLAVAVMDDRQDLTERLQRQIDSLQQRLDSADKKIADLTIRGDSLEQRWTDQAKELVATQSEFGKAQVRIVALEQQNSVLKDEVAQRRIETEGVITAQHDENVRLRRELSVLANAYELLHGQYDELQRQVSVHETEIREIGAIEMRANIDQP